MKIIRNICIFVIIIGVIAVAFNLVLGANTITFLSKETYNDVEIYRYDFYNYIFNIKNSLEDTSLLQLNTQNRTWVNITSNILQEQFWEDLGNNMAYILNTIILGLNIILYPFRISCYLGRMVVSVIGVNISDQTTNIYWLVNTINFLINLQIPYV